MLCTYHQVQDIFKRFVTPFVLQTHGYEVIHASAVKSKAGVIGFCAHSNTGKSSIAYGMSKRGYQLWTDDTLLFEASDNYVITHRLPFKIRLLTDTSLFFENNGNYTGHNLDQ